jgi:ribonucrease Y
VKVLPSWIWSGGNGSEPDQVLSRVEALEAQLRDLEQRRTGLDARERDLDARERLLEEVRGRRLRELERVASLSEAQAREALVKEVEEEARRQAGLALRRIEEETSLDAERRARGILAASMQRLAREEARQTLTHAVHLPNDEMKGRVIGREGRNIRALEALTGVDFVIDETPSTVVLSCFDGVRREIARLTLERLVADGRITPAKCEETYLQAKAEIESLLVEEAERAAREVKVSGLHPELLGLLGRLRYRASYGQNVLEHLVESSHLAGMIAAELGASVEVARRGALLHDVGKAVSHEVDGPHALVGARLARRCGEPEGVVHTIEAHHDDVAPRTVEAVIVQLADAISGARPGARDIAVEQYVSHLRDLEALASRQVGVEKAYAIRAGREIRVMVDPGRVDDEGAALISHEIATAVEREMEYPGRIKITVIRESRSTSFAS